jgi:hypothetical protein
MRSAADTTLRLLKLVVGASVLAILLGLHSVDTKLAQWRLWTCTTCDSVPAETATAACSARFSKPWLPGAVATHTYPDLNESRFRAFVSTLPTSMNDGFGHKARITAWELASARLLNVTYIHRVSTYASLTAGSRGVDIVEDFFDWRQGAPERKDFLETFCTNITVSWDECGGQREHCAAVKSGAGFSSVVKSLGICCGVLWVHDPKPIPMATTDAN